ncbi:60S ribosomal protein L2, mitochondrial precursor [Didymella exigua CBS 183.55]|uniref:Large ribosomal subunit protein bL27m n=1 Tax=Didymella exigua CBS 183.55 TaxID=1150837 RepID=A0A6A5RCV5_9PLEO|nr:60S ribosomal protein L2, mitochondrial precursor [Didymella exigua CBS 183.55]KAF1925038.1 60S ribosomal protein L2, mitochondrial precursor [Didymella exigua CBS 183.55]
MLLPRILAPVRASIQTPSTFILPASRVIEAIRSANGASAHVPTLSFVRHSAHQAQGRANGAKDGPGKRLGAKKSGGEYVIPGNIIFRQRGTHWFPGENCKFGRDHCVFATESGYVRYYKDPLKHPKRQYIGVALEKDHQLPYARNVPRARRLGFVAVSVTPSDAEAKAVVNDLQTGEGPGSDSSIKDTSRQVKIIAKANKGYAYREANWEIGRAAEKANVQVKKFIPGDRWAAWRKSQARIKANIEKKKLRNAGKKTAKPKKRQQRA